MSRPRQVLENGFCMITRRCTQRQFLLRPDPITNQAFTYCLVEAALRFEIDIVLTMAESNHHHTIIFDRHGRFPAFTEHFHKMLARCLNARWGRWENFWAAEEPCVTRLLTPETVMDKLVYAAINPVKDLLVDEVRQWPGTNGYVHLLQRKPLSATRPRHFFREHGVMPREVSVSLVIPPELGNVDDVIAELRARVNAAEDAIRAHRLSTGRHVLGRRRVTEQSWRGSPQNAERRRTLRPRFAGPSFVLAETLRAYKEFLAAYDDARRAWKSGQPALFPLGTYWLARFASIQLAPAAS